MTDNTFKHREAWLHAMAEHLTNDRFEPQYEVPANYRLSCGFPSRNPLNGAKNQVLGQCWYEDASGDKSFEIFISPVIDDPIRVAGILAHELCHAVAGKDAKHGKAFKAVATHIGLEGKMTATTESKDFKLWAGKIIETLGPYPMAALDARKMVPAQKKQSTRMIKCECPMCSYTARVASKWINEVGAPHCPEHGEMEVIKKEDEE